MVTVTSSYFKSAFASNGGFCDLRDRYGSEAGGQGLHGLTDPISVPQALGLKGDGDICLIYKTQTLT